MDDLGPETVVSQSGDVISREVNGQLVLLTPSTGTVHELDEIGVQIWSLCAKPRSIESIADRIVEEYDVEKEVAEEDITSFIGQMIEIGAVRKG